MKKIAIVASSLLVLWSCSTESIKEGKVVQKTVENSNRLPIPLPEVDRVVLNPPEWLKGKYLRSINGFTPLLGYRLVFSNVGFKRSEPTVSSLPDGTIRIDTLHYTEERYFGENFYIREESGQTGAGRFYKVYSSNKPTGAKSLRLFILDKKTYIYWSIFSYERFVKQ